ncbi:ATP-dependent Clp protease proteolytic subunit [bacterium]|nr:ATP-dependent Clp protease proteolytic subunit [bacterium]
MVTTLPIPKERVLFLSSEVKTEEIFKVITKIKEIATDDKYLEALYGVYGIQYIPYPIELSIDTNGGVVYDGLALHDVISACSTPIHTIAHGKVMSIGMAIFLAGHKRYCHRSSTFMIHQISTGVWGSLQHISDTLEESTRLENVVNQIILARTTITMDQLTDLYTSKKNWFIDADEALTLGVVDEIL